jgi:EAL domain-containing protein (putative c-di-GMP-specific phosphodiesterase class I)
MESVLASTTLRSVFLPIILGGEEVFGYEALTRLDSGTPLDDPELLFAYAERCNRLVDLELRCMENAFRDGAALTERGLLFMNLHPSVLAHSNRFAIRVRELSSTYDVPLSRVVFEITEQAKLASSSQWAEDVAALKAQGARFAFDDFGVAYSHLLHMETMRPSFIKLSMWCGQLLDEDETKQKIVKNTLALANEFNSRVIVEGVENDGSLNAASALGVELMQGFRFGRPASAKHLLAGPTDVN